MHPYFFTEDNCAPGVPFAPLMIDALTHRNEMGFVNNSRFANARMTPVLKMAIVEKNGAKYLTAEFAIYLMATQTIAVGEEILFNYGYAASTAKKMGLLDIASKKMCFGCGDTKKPLIAECDCELAKYCSEACKKRDQEAHRQLCNFWD